jgi:hypothetical protein
MSRTLPVVLDAVNTSRRCHALSGLGRAGMRWVLAMCIAVMAGCSGMGTTVDNVWLDEAGGDVALGKTLVLALSREVEVVAMLEDEWARQLRDRGVEAALASQLLPGEIPPSEERVVAVLKASGFDTLLVSRVVDVKHIERNVSAYQVAVVETKLYDTKTEKSFWSARADTFLVNPSGERITELRSERARQFVETIIEEMTKSKLF